MQAATLNTIRRQLTDRKTRLTEAIADTAPQQYHLVSLLQQVDSALDRLETEEYARCLVCGEHVDDKDLLRNPLMEYCLCSLSPAQQRALEHDLKLARRIQAGLLPVPHLRSSGWEAFYLYEPAGVVSGDYCDLWSRNGGESTVHFAVGDVAGKGLASSILMAHLQAAFRSLLGASVPLSDLVARINRQLLDAGISTHYATLACGRLGEDGQVEMVNAGHCPPIVVRENGIETIGPTGVPVGLLADKPYEVHNFRLAAGENIVLYTDGLTEAQQDEASTNPEDGEYGAERLVRFLSTQGRGLEPNALVRAIREDLTAFLDGAKHEDDLTILVVQRTG
jgi:sigma-B regulation protein RsbU (phosphoserine phosphatase)